MIFDSIAAGQLYELSIRGDKDALVRLHVLSEDFIRAIAMSISPDAADDLCQEGHIKLHNLVMYKSIDLDRRSLYTYLSVTLRNHMIDHMRRECDYAYLSDDIECAPSQDMVVELARARAYISSRFPSLPCDTSLDMADYVTQALTEGVTDMRKRVIRTLYSLYPINKAKALVIYYAAEIAAAAELLRVQPDYDQALIHANNGHEFTLIPEFVLITNSNPADCPACSTTGCAIYIKQLLRDDRRRKVII